MDVIILLSKRVVEARNPLILLGFWALFYYSHSSMSTKSGTKNYSFYNSKSELQWIVSIHGTFNYNGSTSNCIKSSTSSQLINSTWKVKEAVASRKNNSAIGDFVVKHYMLGVPVQTKDVQLTLTCSPNGTLS